MLQEDRHTLAARALLARLSDEPDWVSAVAAALRDAERAGMERAAGIVHEQQYPQGGHNDEWHGAMLMRDYCEGAIRAAAD